MKTFIAFVLFAAAVAHQIPSNRELDQHWQEFKKTFGKTYTGDEEARRRVIWEENVAKIIHHNLQADLGVHSYRRGINGYSDMEHDEFVKTMNGYKRNENFVSSALNWSPLNNVVIPDTVDWRLKGVVTPIKNQGKCGSCWSFSTTGSLEAQHKIKTGNLVSLSEQNLIDCSSAEGNDGCAGGWMDQAFEYIEENNGIDTENSYPYKAENGTCHFDSANVGATVSGYVDLPAGDEDALKEAIATVGPVSVAIDAGWDTFQTYKSGIYNQVPCDREYLNHAVLVVGYGTENGVDYWLVKNSWGTSWGMDGYIKMSRNRNNQCGIASKASYPLV